MRPERDQWFPGENISPLSTPFLFVGLEESFILAPELQNNICTGGVGIVLKGTKRKGDNRLSNERPLPFFITFAVMTLAAPQFAFSCLFTRKIVPQHTPSAKNLPHH